MNKQIKLWQSILSTVLVAAVILTGVFVYVGKLRSGVEQLYDGAQQLADGSNQIEDGLSQVNDGTGSLNDGLKQYTDGVAQVDGGLGTLSDGLGTYTDGVAQVDKGLGSLQSGLKTYTSGVASIKTGTDAALTQAAIPTFAAFMGTDNPGTLSLLANQIVAEAQVNGYSTATNYARDFVRGSVFAGNQAEMDRIMNDPNLASDDATKATTGAAIKSYVGNNYATKAAAMANTQPFATSGINITYAQLVSAYTTYAGVANADGNVATASGLDANVAYIDGLVAQSTGYTLDQIQGGPGGNTAAITAAGSVLTAGAFVSAASVSAEDIAGLGSTYTADRAKRTMADASMASYPKLIAGLAVMYKAIYDVNDGSKQLVAANSDLMGGVKQLKDGTGQLTANNSTIMDGLSQLKDGTGQLVSNNDALLSGSSQLSDGSGQLYDGSQTLSDGLGTLVDGVHTLLKGVGGK